MGDGCDKTREQAEKSSSGRRFLKDPSVLIRAHGADIFCGAASLTLGVDGIFTIGLFRGVEVLRLGRVLVDQHLGASLC